MKHLILFCVLFLSACSSPQTIYTNPIEPIGKIKSISIEYAHVTESVLVTTERFVFMLKPELGIGVEVILLDREAYFRHEPDGSYTFYYEGSQKTWPVYGAVQVR